jgi:hypothetical protein
MVRNMVDSFIRFSSIGLLKLHNLNFREDILLAVCELVDVDDAIRVARWEAPAQHQSHG